MRQLCRRYLGALIFATLLFGLLGTRTAVAAPSLATATDNTFSWSTGGNAVWVGVDSVDAHDGVDYAVSGDISDNQTSYAEFTVNGPGTLSWWFMTSTEVSFDYLLVRDNGSIVKSWSGAWGWTQDSYSVPAGTHTLRFEYNKDGSVSQGTDSVYIDQVSYTNDAPVGKVDGAHLAGNEVKLLPSAPEAGAQAGFAVGISGDTMVSGSNWDDTTVTDGGSVTVYKRSGGLWAESQFLVPPDAVASDRYGTAVALDGDALAVTCSTRERIYTYYDFGSGFVQWGGPITAPMPGYGFGGTIAISGNTLVVGARGYNGYKGRVYVYEYNAGWDLQATLDPPDPVTGYEEQFGYDVDIDGNRLIVGAPYHNHPGAPGGAAFIYDRVGTTWSLTQEVDSSRGYEASTTASVYGMGEGVAISGDTAVAGDNQERRADVFTLDGTWSRTDQLSPPSVQQYSAFGRRLAIDGDTILVGDSWYDWSTKGGTVFAYTRSNDRFFDLVENIQPAVGDSSAGFGDAIDIEGAEFVIGSRIMDGTSGGSQGATFVYGGAYYRVADGGTLEVPAERGVLANDTDANGDTLSVAGYTLTTRGTLSVYDNGSLRYDDVSGSPAELPFTYEPEDPNQAGNWTNAYITIAPPPLGSPVFNDGDYYISDTTVGIAASMTHVRQYRTKVDGGSWSAWKWYASSSLSATIPAEVGQHTVYLEVRGSGGNRSFNETLFYAASTAYTRFSGSDRYATAILASRGAFPTGSCDSVIIATGLNYPDALSAAGLGGAAHSPVLLVGGDVLRADIKTEIQRLTQGHATFKVYIMGSTAAVSAKMEASIRAALTGESVERFSGANRYATAQLVAAKVKSLQGAGFGNKAILVTGADYVDGLLVGPAAYDAKAPILLVGTGVDAGLVNMLKALGTTDLVVLGTTARIGTNVETYLKSVVPGLSTRRVSTNTNTYTRSAEAAEYFANPANGFGLTWAGIGIATAEKFPDGLGAGCVEGELGGTLLLTRTASLPTEISPRLTAHKGTPETVRFYGSTAAVSQAVETSVKNLLAF